MPKSRQRQKRTGRPYVPQPSKKKPRKSPKWFGVFVLGLMGAGVALIIWNYMRGDSASNTLLWVGLGIIASGFIAATQWR